MTDAPVNVLLLGKTGHGKSSTGNSILGYKAFKATSSISSVTKEVELEWAEMDGRLIKVVDVPASDYWDMSSLERHKMLNRHMIEALSMCKGGVDAFVYVIRFGTRFTDEESSCLDSLRTFFGRNYLRHMIVVMTFGDHFQDFMEEELRNISFVDWCREQHGAFRHLFNECQERIILFNNREKDHMKMLEQRKQFINLADDLRKRNGRYSSKNFTVPKELRERMIGESATSVLRESIEQRLGLLRAEIEHLCKDPSDSDRKKIKQRIRDLKEEIDAEDKGDNQTKHLRDLVDMLEQNLTDVSSIWELSQELENIRETKTMFSLMGSGFTIAGGALGLLVPFVGAVAALTGAVSTVVGRMQIDSKEKEIQNTQKEIMKQRRKSNSLFPENSEREFQRQSKED